MVTLALTWGYMALMLAAAITDAVRYIIPNAIPIAIVILFALYVIVMPVPLRVAGGHVLVGALAMLVCFGLFARGWIGGGDAKLIAAAALWSGPEGLVPFLFWTAMAGGALALALIVIRRMPWSEAYTARFRQLRRDGGVPYGIAICVGALVVLAQKQTFLVFTAGLSSQTLTALTMS